MISFIFGTRPEAIKLCPVVLELRRRKKVGVHVCVTGQHRAMLDQVLEVFGVRPDTDLDLMAPNQGLAELTSRLLVGVDRHLAEVRPAAVVVQGDTTTAFAASLAAFYRRIPVAHVEAGLRTGNPLSPFPEETNRVLIGRMASLHFAATRRAADNLRAEGVPEDRVFVTGNTVVDALLATVGKVRAVPPAIPGLDEATLARAGKLVVVTGHRRESFGPGFEAICRAIRRIAEAFPSVLVVYPVHLNPNVREPVFRLLSNLPNVRLIEPLDYLSFVRLMDAAWLLLTDSGGIQEEAPSLGKPVLVMRDTTERPEAVEAGVARLVGASEEAIYTAAAELISNDAVRAGMTGRPNPFGDGHASERIADALIDFVGPRAR